MESYEACPSCKDARASGDLAEAIGCRDCGGKGILRTQDSWICNGCGDSMCVGDETSPYGLPDCKVKGHYASEYPWDMTTYKFSLCEKCLRALFNSFKIPPAIFEYSLQGFGDELNAHCTYEEDRRHHEKRLWTAAGEDAKKLKLGLCNRTIECSNPAKYRVFVSSHLTNDTCCEAHKNDIRFCNAHFVDESFCSGLTNADEPTNDQLRTILRGYVLSAIKPAPALTYFQFICDPALKFMGLDYIADNGNYSMIFEPSGQSTKIRDTAAPENTMLFEFPEGNLFVGPSLFMSQFRRDPGAFGILSMEDEDIMPNMPKGEPEPDPIVIVGNSAWKLAG